MENERRFHLEDLRRRYSDELGELLDMGLYDNEPLSPDPFSMGIGETSLENLSDEELSAIREALFEKLGVNPQDPEFIHRTYVTEAPEGATVTGKINVNVFKTNRENLFTGNDFCRRKEKMGYRSGY